MNTRKIILNIAVLGVIFVPFISPIVTFAQTSNITDYTVLAPLPGTTDCDTNIGNGGVVPECKTNLEKYLPGLFKLMIGLAAVFTVFNIVIGGFQYMTSDAVQGKKSGLERVQNAVWGLVLVIVAWLILNQINPGLLEINLNIQSAQTSLPFGAGGTLSTPVTGASGDVLTGTEADARTLLQQKNIDVNAGPCVGGQTKGCTNIVGMPLSTVNGLVELVNASGVRIMVTGATEDGHSTGGTHGVGGSGVDVAPSAALNTVIKTAIQNQNPTPATYYSGIVNGKEFRAIWEPVNTQAGQVASSGNHWHIEFK